MSLFRRAFKLALVCTTTLVPTAAMADPISLIVSVAVAAASGASVAAIATLVVTAALTFGLSLAINALFGPKQRQQERQASVLALNIGEVSREALFGEVVTGGSLIDAFNYGGTYGTDWEVLMIAVADHKCASLEGFYVNDTYVAFGGSGTVSGYNSQLVVHWLDGSATQTLPSIVTNGGWSTTGALDGIALVVVAYKADDPQSTSPVWSGGRPSFKWRVKGKFCYDPRKDSTVGGSGSHRWATPSTWEWSDNLSVCRYNWVRGVYAKDQVGSTDMLLVGRGLTSLEAPEAQVFAYANLCDETVALAAGGTVKRYTFNGIIRADEQYVSVERKFAECCGGMILQVAGAVEVEPGYARSVTASFTDDDVVVGTQVNWSNWRGASDNQWVNTVVPRYVEPSQQWQDHAAPVRRVTGDLTTDKGPREQTLSLSGVTNRNQASRVGEISRRLGRLVSTGSVTLPPRFAGITEGDWVQWTSARRFGGATRTFRVEAYSLDEKWRNTLQLREIASSCYSWTTGDEITPGATATDQTAPTGARMRGYDQVDFAAQVYGATKPADNATADMTLFYAGTNVLTFQGNTARSGAAAGYQNQAAAYQTALVGTAYAEMNISGDLNVMSLQISGAGTSTYTDQDLYAFYIRSTGVTGIYRLGTNIFSTTIATGLSGKIAVAYDGVSYRFFVAGVEYGAGLAGMKASGSGLTHYVRWFCWDANTTYTGFRILPFTENVWANVGGFGKPEDNATRGNNLVFNGDAELGTTDGWFSGIQSTGSGGTVSVITGEQVRGKFSFRLSKSSGANGIAFGAKVIPVVPGRKYNIRMAVYGSAATSAGLYLRMMERAARPATDFIQIGDQTSFQDLIGNGPIALAPVFVDLIYIPPAGIYWVAPTIYSWTSAPTIVVLDDVQFMEVLSWGNGIGGTGKPEDFSTSADNMIINGSLRTSSSGWALIGAVHETTGGAGDPSIGRLRFPASLAPNYAVANDNTYIALNGATSLYVSGFSYMEGGGVTGTFQVVIDWHSAAVGGAYISSSYVSMIQGTLGAWLPFYGKVDAPAGAARAVISLQRSNNTGVTYATCIRVAKTQGGADVTLLQPVVSRLSGATGNASTTMTDTNGRRLTKIADTGAARDGDVVSFSTTMPSVPTMVFLPGGNAAASGSNIAIQAVGLSVSGFTMKAKAQAVTAGSTITDSTTATPSGSTPDIIIIRSNSGHPFDGNFTYTYNVTVGTLAPGEPGSIAVDLYARISGSWVNVASRAHGTSNVYTVRVNLSTVDYAAGVAQFGMSVSYAEGSGTALNSLNSVVYTLGSVTETNLTPAGASSIPWMALLA